MNVPELMVYTDEGWIQYKGLCDRSGHINFVHTLLCGANTLGRSILGGDRIVHTCKNKMKTGILELSLVEEYVVAYVLLEDLMTDELQYLVYCIKRRNDTCLESIEVNKYVEVVGGNTIKHHIPIKR